MSLIGSRPLIIRVQEIHYLRNYYGFYQLNPGITGLAQINARDTVGNYDKVRWDRAYIQNVSFLMDFCILVETVLKVLKSEDIVDDSKQKIGLIEDYAYNRTNKTYNDKSSELRENS